MIKGIDKDDPDYARTLVVCSSADTYLDWSADSMAIEGSEIHKKSKAMMMYYESMETSTQEVWTDDVPRLRAKYDSYGLPMTYIDLNKAEGRIDLAKGEKTTGKCFCGKCEWELTGDAMMNVLCHCQWCSSGLGMCPVHLHAVKNDQWKITKGQEYIKIWKGKGVMTFAKCTSCGSGIYQGPENGPFRAFYPRMFQGYVSG